MNESKTKNYYYYQKAILKVQPSKPVTSSIRPDTVYDSSLLPTIKYILYYASQNHGMRRLL